MSQETRAGIVHAVLARIFLDGDPWWNPILGSGIEFDAL